MYEAFFEMKHTPFTRDIPPELLYESPYVADAIGRLTYAADRQLFAVFTADAGCGKSTLIRRLLEIKESLWIFRIKTFDNVYTIVYTDSKERR